MPKPIFDPEFWRERLEHAPMDSLHHAVFVCPTDRWERIAAKHREILQRHIRAEDSILDAGCAWGRLLGLLPETWRGMYAGVDLSPDFIRLAMRLHPCRRFFVGDMRCMNRFIAREFDWSVMISIRPMIKRECGADVWSECERELRRVAKHLLYLEYDEKDEGSLE